MPTTYDKITTLHLAVVHFTANMVVAEPDCQPTFLCTAFQYDLSGALRSVSTSWDRTASLSVELCRLPENHNNSL